MLGPCRSRLGHVGSRAGHGVRMRRRVGPAFSRPAGWLGLGARSWSARGVGRTVRASMRENLIVRQGTPFSVLSTIDACNHEVARVVALSHLIERQSGIV